MLRFIKVMYLHILELDKLERNHLLAIELLGCQHNILDIEQLEELILPNHIKILLVFSKEPKSFPRKFVPAIPEHWSWSLLL